VHAAPAIQELKHLLPQCLLPDQVRIGSRLAQALARIRAGESPRLPLDRWLDEARASIRTRQDRASILRHLRYPAELPITARKDDIVVAIKAHQVVVVAGETGSGKTTQLPKMCLEAGLGQRARIGCTQPRRVAALSIARRLAEELDVEPGREVGSKIRFADNSRPETSVKLMTDGILLAEIQGDPLLAEYDAILIDEAHERSLNIDFLLGYLKQLLRKRDDLKLIITSATIDTDRFARAFDNAPVIEVSGRLYPVELRYSPLDEHAEDEGDVTYIDAAVNVLGRVLDESVEGDVLVFMPGERDIRETADLLRTRQGDWLDIVPLFGRLTSEEQQRVFAPGPRRRVVIATNIAETSLTVPRIRYVIDTGLARISRYHPGTRSKRLPVEPIAQSSANQRKGRCGRVSGGICIRLYSEQDFLDRRPFVEPEIQRADLADVILRMKAFKLGEIETFPFLDPPTPAAIHGAYQLLQELGALDEQQALTPLGRNLAHLPVDPAIGRMILEAHREGALEDVLVIASGLSVQDPRERPLDKRDAADAAHRRFLDAQSDFITLLNIWNAFHDTWESLKTQNQLRRFCKSHFLSYIRMREWVDIHDQLAGAVDDLQDCAPAEASSTPAGAPADGAPSVPGRAPRANPFPPRYAAIHRSILTGLFGHVARREDRNLFRLGGNKQAMIFPGSGLFAKTERDKARKPGPQNPADGRNGGKNQQPDWMIAGEIVETSRLFVRTVAAIDPEWVIELAPHLIKITHENAHWDARLGRVLCTEKVLLRGLVLRERQIGYLQVNPAEATAIFIRTALVEEEIEAPAPPVFSAIEEVDDVDDTARRSGHHKGPRHPKRAERTVRGLPTTDGPARVRSSHRFIEHNRRLREKIEMWQTRLPHRVVTDLDETLFQFYAARIQDVGSTHELNRLVKSQEDPGFLCATEKDLLGGHAASFEKNLFPDTLPVGDGEAPVRYSYAPGEERDGVTLRLSMQMADALDAAQLEWRVPALREERVACLLQLLPKTLRRPLMPLNHATREILANVRPDSPSFLAAMSGFVKQRYGVDIPPTAWPVNELPGHLRPRFEIMGREEQPLAAGRNLDELRKQVRELRAPDEAGAWQECARIHDKYGLTSWSFGDLPERHLVTEAAGFPVYAHPGLHVENGAVNLRLFRKPGDARTSHREAVSRLAELVLHREINWLQKDLRALKTHGVLYSTLGTGDELLATAWENLRRHLFAPPVSDIVSAAAFAGYVEDIKKKTTGLIPRFIDSVGAVLQKRQELLTCPHRLPVLRAELDLLVPPQFLARVPFEQLAHLPRYLQALKVRVERAALNPAKDVEKSVRVKPYADAARELRAKTIPSSARPALLRFLALVEEYKVSIYAQELGTAQPVSPKKLDEALVLARQAVAGG
jgi:ATP-dependent helicase HrpA